MRQVGYKLASTGRKARFELDQTTAMGGATVALFTYIVYHFIYPLVSKGLLF
jgi:hypothetical protein